MKTRQIPDWPFAAINALAAIFIVSAGLGANLVKQADVSFLVGASFVAVAASILAITGNNAHPQPLWRKAMVIVPLILFVAFGSTKPLPTSTSESSKYVPLPKTSALPQVMKPKGNTLDYDHIDWQISISDDTRAPLVDGKPFKLQGFIITDGGSHKLARTIMAHCVACSLTAELDLVLPKGSKPPKDGQWVEAQGTVKVEKVNGTHALTLIAEKVTQIAEPQEPYLTP